ncbi:sigma-70 family RNA polymerase sigma factor [Microbispora sp. ATCC PTA-5024]|uniref:sigma-70 family RNA polymerase sigma factor n=1 Tax=Microbispora sp. ATCC PTA-5024 TaxID=316330 RepID=UPI0003DDF08F|nr:sigma-70 family RNA polymerase sigma factor [Microbispora sp. ATCC PTA-5024]ETK37622.1 RNA polymerase sigma70 factor [Microbispora sp. ATCC PTA-5024]
MRPDLTTLAERHRGELTGYCYRMLGSPFEAEDAVQETFLRAWRVLDRYDESRGSARTWLYRIATGICLDMLKGAQRRARAVDLGPASAPGPDIGAPLPDGAWVLPVPDGRVLPEGGDPAEIAVARETVALAFVAALQRLPPRQRAVLILRDVLCWQAAEVAGLLGVTVASVNSGLQRARAALATAGEPGAEPYRPLDEGQRRLLARYVEAFERYDVEALVALLHEDATMSMPPFAWWLSGRADIRAALVHSAGPCAGSRLVPTAANGMPAFGHYLPDGDGGHRPFALVVLEVREGRVAGLTSYLDGPRLFPLFGLPPSP